MIFRYIVKLENSREHSLEISIDFDIQVQEEDLISKVNEVITEKYKDFRYVSYSLIKI